MDWKHGIFVILTVLVGVFIYIPYFALDSYESLMAFIPQIAQFQVLYLHNNIPQVFTSWTISMKSNWTLFTKEELKKYTNKDNGFYLALLGKVYDVSKGAKYYGAGGSYHFFTGRDATRAFVTGDFSESGLIDDVIGLNSEELMGIDKWVKFFNKEYKLKGKLIGRYYDTTGKPTDYNNKVRRLIKEAKDDREAEERQKLLHPPCNAEWSQDTGSRVWCTKMSGGIERDWIGVPRQLYDPGSHEYHCACIKEDQLEAYRGRIKEYPNCHSYASSCKINS